MYTDSRVFRFSASHKLPNLPANHPEGRLHGHSYTVEVFVSGNKLDVSGRLIDLELLGEFDLYLKQNFDRRDLNEVMLNAAYTTPENLAYHFYQWTSARWSGVRCVKVTCDLDKAEYCE